MRATPYLSAGRRAPARARGFTLVELICVVTILGVLAASASSRYVNLTTEAHHGSVAATAGAFQSALHLANGGCIVLGFAGRDNLPIFGDGNVDFNGGCFPSSTNGNNNNNVNANRCLQIWNGLLQLAPTISTAAGADTDFRAQGGGTTCIYTYRDDPSTLRRFTYNAVTGVIAVTNP